jgi:hypothetical protein
MMKAMVCGAGDRVLDLDGPARGNDGGRQERGDVPCSGGEDPHGGRGASGTDHAACRDRAAAGRSPPAGAATDSEHVGEYPERSERRNECCKLMADTSYLAPELAASRAVAQVAPGHAAWTDAPVVRDDQLLADLRAVRVACLERLGEPHASAHQQRLHGRHRYSERRCHVDVGHAAELAHQQRRALLLGQPPQVRDQAPQRLALLRCGGRVVNGRPDNLQHLGRRRCRPAQLVDAAVVGHPIQPGSQRQLAIVRAQAGICTHEDVLQSILGILPGAGKHLLRVREQPLAVTVVDDPEGIIVTSAKEGYKLLV